MAKSVDVVDLISTLFDSGKFKEALNIPNEERLTDAFKDNCGDIISNLVEKIQDDTLVIKPSLHGACEQMLSLIVEKISPEEGLLEFIERIDLAKNDAQFGIILSPLQQLLKKLTSKRGRSLEWCLNSITTYLENIPVPEYDLEGDERKLLDSDPNMRRITKVYSMLPSFYQYFIDELASVNNCNAKTKEILTAFLISLLGKPMIFIDVDPKANERSEARQVCFIMVQDICRLEKNVLKFLVYIDDHIDEQKKPFLPDYEGLQLSPYDCKYKVNMTTLSCLLYCVYSGHFELPSTATPQVYSNEYVNNGIINVINHFLSYTEYGPLAKGLALCEALNNRLVPKTSNVLLSLSKNFDMTKKLAHVAIFSTFLNIRKNAVNIIGVHINKFDYKGRCMLVKFLLETSNHSGMIGFVIGVYKNAINEAYNDEVMNDCFKVPQLTSMIKRICHLPHGAESDLMELADQIIAALNFLRFLILKDADNKTGIKDIYATIEKDYLEVLRTALKMSKAHYELKLKDLKDGKKHPEETADISINVGGNILDSMPVENKVQVIEQALNCFHLIEGLIARLTELL